MTETKLFDQIKLAAANKDKEGAHIQADKLLIEALRMAARGGLSAEKAEEFIELWLSVGKWYS